MKPILVLCLLWLALTSARAQEDSFYLKPGDRVVFYGDSITDQRLYTTFIESSVVTRFPKLEVTFVHSGWGGDRVSGGGGGPIDIRLKRDVFAYHPSVMTIMLGMNDGSYRSLDETIFNTYRHGYEHIIASVKSALPGIRITVIAPSPFDDVTQAPKFEGGYNAVLIRYGEFVKELGEREHLTVADLNGPVIAALVKAKETNPELSQKIIPDRVHPGPAGHLLMAAALLRSWNAPKIVSAVEIDANGAKSTAQKGAHVSGMTADGAALSWAETEEALPMPIDLKDPVFALALRSSDVMDALDQETLRVSGLKQPRYILKIDGVRIDEFTPKQLEEGVNLAALQTPMLKQAMKVHQLTIRHNNIHFTRWRQVQVPLANEPSSKVQDSVKELIATLDGEEARVVREQRAAAQPVSHRFELVPE